MPTNSTPLIPSLTIFFVLFTYTHSPSSAHSFLLKPRGDFKSFSKPECRMGGPPHAPDDNCPGPCFATSSYQYNSQQQPTVYKRGQIVSMVWSRNNHIGGFVRFSLVPNNLRMNATAHNQLTFRYACFESDLHKCTDRNCGTDDASMAYATRVEIPTSYPDGDYILGWAWYGGTLHMDSNYGDYYSCSSIVIRGGRMTSSYQPRFIPGENLTSNSTCPASTNRLGMCRREPCFGYEKADLVPAQFAHNRRPPAIETSWFDSSPQREALPPPGVPSPVQGGQEDRMVKVNKLILIRAPNGEKLAMLDSHFSAVKLSSRNERISFVAWVQGAVQSVGFYLDGNFIRNELEVPYAFWGDDNMQNEYNAWPSPIFGRTFEIKVSATGRDGNSAQKVFSIRLE